MRVTAECIPCYLNQCLNAMEKGGWPEERRDSLLVELLPVIEGLDRDKTPAENSTIVLHRLVELMGGGDPFAAAKRESNMQALQYIDRLHRLVREAGNPLKQALKFAVAGNVVDMGLFDDYDLEGAVQSVIKTGFSIDHWDRFCHQLGSARRALIIGDNSGEIVFDRLLVETLIDRGIKVNYGVKGSFILNDATIDDARQAGIDKLCSVINNGNNFLGTIEDRCATDFLHTFRGADIVISKGQANYESLEGTQLAGDKTFFLLKAKCPVVAKQLGANYGDIVFMQNSLVG